MRYTELVKLHWLLCSSDATAFVCLKLDVALPSVTRFRVPSSNPLLIQETQGWKLIQHHGGHQSPERDYTQRLVNASLTVAT